MRFHELRCGCFSPPLQLPALPLPGVSAHAVELAEEMCACASLHRMQSDMLACLADEQGF